MHRLVEESRALAAFQEAPDSKEAIETIPLLERSDLRRESEGYKNEEREIAGIPVVFHDYFTNGIAYINLIFDSNQVEPEKLPYLSLLKSIFSFVDTDKHSYSDLNNEVNIYAGGLSFETGAYVSRKKKDKVSVLSDISLRCLYGNLDKALDLVEEIITGSRYDDADRLYEIIAELKSRLQMTLNSAGHVAAALRATSYFSKTGQLKERINGIEFYKFVEGLERDYQERKEELILNIKEILAMILRPEGLLVSFTGDEAGYELFKARFAGFAEVMRGISQGASDDSEVHIPLKDRSYRFAESLVPVQKNEGFKTSAQIQYVARAGRFAEDGSELAGAMRVFRTIMSYDYLWFNIRVQGGAYGCMCNFSLSGENTFVTYRDPNLSRSNDIFEGIPEYLENFDADDREMTKYVIGTMSSVDTPLTPAGKGSRDMNAYVADVTLEEAQKIRSATIDCTQEDIRKLAPYIKRALSEGNICVVGNEKKIEEEKELFKTTRNLFE